MLDEKTIFNEYPDIVTVKEMKEMLRIGNNKAYSLLTTGEIQSIKTGTKGRIRYIPKKCIIDYLNKQLEIV